MKEKTPYPQRLEELTKGVERLLIDFGLRSFTAHKYAKEFGREVDKKFSPNQGTPAKVKINDSYEANGKITIFLSPSSSKKPREVLEEYLSRMKGREPVDRWLIEKSGGYIGMKGRAYVCSVIPKANYTNKKKKKSEAQDEDEGIRSLLSKLSPQKQIEIMKLFENKLSKD